VKKGSSGSQETALHVDHCHSTGKVRDLLCSRCNHTLGKFKENPKVFESFMATKSKQVEGLWNGKRYTNPNIQTKWHYFQLGWSLRGIK
jgi:hypothetical protein